MMTTTMVILLRLLFAVCCAPLPGLVALHCYFVPALTALHVIAGCCTDSEDSREESGGEDNSVRHHYHQNNGQFHTFGSDIEDEDDHILQKNPLPPLGQTGAYLDRQSIDLESTYSEVDHFGRGSPVVVSQSKHQGVRKQSLNKREKRPSKENSGHLSRRNKANAREEQDDCRPDSDKHAFDSLQNAKHRARPVSYTHLTLPTKP
jgi:hypothetical protein